MKHFITLILILVASISCQKDEPNDNKETKTTPTENKTGQDEFVFFDGTGIFAIATANGDSIQEVVNLGEVDSIKYQTNWQSPSITVQGTECWRYYITFYRNGQIILERTAFAKFRNLAYTQILQNEGWNENVLYFHCRKTGEFMIDFDHECLKWKKVFKYQRRIIYTIGNPVVKNEFIKSNSCTRENLQYPRKFKP